MASPQVIDGGEPELRSGGGDPQMHTDAGCVGRMGSQGIDGGESEKCTHGGDDPQMRTDAGGRKRPQTPQCKNSELPRSQLKESSLGHTIIKANNSFC